MTTAKGKSASREEVLHQRDLEWQRGWGQFLLSVVIVLVVVWSWNGSEIELYRLAESGGRIAEFLARMMPPDLSVLPVVIESSAETLRIAILGTVGCIVLSIVLGMLAATNLSPSWIHVPVKAVLAVIRGIPLILVAMLMVGAVGLGALPGILAIAFHATGMLAKFYAEAIESVDPAPMEALESVGATFLQKLRFGAWPQIAPDILRDTLFRFEMNLRESLILGVVGAGGIGFYIQMYVRAFQYEKVATLTIVVIAFVVLIELANNAIRRLLR
ncbi:phosphonate ABC transporter, permease protein PhnE [Neoaquamicrobium sediminum]|uniref:Phosphonate ABC transporter, permease protein PhnE n=1 Tax=Neoaquamicrobium sediminum TaxID=1849104 RepID=A0ABV3WZ65_9HYPH